MNSADGGVEKAKTAGVCKGVSRVHRGRQGPEHEDEGYGPSDSAWCRVHDTSNTTPAVALGIADRPWSIGELLEKPGFLIL